MILSPWWEPITGNDEIENIKDVIKTNFINEGNYNLIFQDKIAKLLNTKYIVTTVNGTTAIFLALKAFKIGIGDEVIVPNFTYIATINAITLCGAKPVLVDINIEDLNIDVSKIIKKINKRTKAIIPVHISGRSANMNKISKIASRYKLKVIEDAAEAFLSKNNKYLGTIADIGCFSLSPNKIISTGQGGFIATNNKSTRDKILQLKYQGMAKRGSGGDDKHNFEGYNFKFNDLLAAFGIGQLKSIRKRIKKQIKTYNIYYEELSNLDFIKFLKFDIKSGEVPLWTDILLENRSKFTRYLNDKKIPYRKFWLPINKQRKYKSNNTFFNSEMISRNGLWLPSSMKYEEKQIYYICKVIKKM